MSKSEKTCSVCGKTFLADSMAVKAKFCSDRCRDLDKESKITRFSNCPKCGRLMNGKCGNCGDQEGDTLSRAEEKMIKLRENR